MNLKMLHDLVLVVPDKEEGHQSTAGGLIVVTNEKPVIKQGTVESIGDKCKDVKVGDRVLFCIHDVLQELSFGDSKGVVLTETSIPCILE